MAQEPSFGKSYEWSLGATDSLSKSHSGITFENTWRVPRWCIFVHCNDRSRRHFEFQAPDDRSSQWSNKSTALVTCEYPNHEIKGSFTTTRGEFSKPDIYSRKRWWHIQHIANEFWSCYLQSLQECQKWEGKRRNFKIGDIVVVYQNNVSRNQWSIARIIDVKRKKGLVRSVLIHTGEQSGSKNSKHELEQPIDKMVLILGRDEVQFPTKKAMCWDKISYLEGSQVKLHHKGVQSENLKNASEGFWIYSLWCFGSFYNWFMLLGEPATCTTISHRICTYFWEHISISVKYIGV